ncbi:type II secretion system protein N [Crenobacter intestini]|nr:type II secretion system protein N [Crenobacter intestini]
MSISTPFERWRFAMPARLAPALAHALPWLCLLACAFWLGGSLSTLLAPPGVRALALTQPAPAADAGRVAALHAFGEVPAVPVQGTTAGALRLIGVYSSGNAQTDFALVDEGGQVRPWRVGQTLGGAQLVRVLPRAVVLREGALERELALVGAVGNAPEATAQPSAPAAAVPSLPPVAAAPAIPAAEPVTGAQPASAAVPHNSD